MSCGAFNFYFHTMIKKTLYFGNPAYLSLANAQLVVKRPNQELVKHEKYQEPINTTRTIPIEDIGLVVIESRQVTITAGLIDALLENNAAVVTCNSKCMPVGLLLPLAGNTIQNERFRAQIDSSLPLKKQLWAQTISQKIANQKTVLQRNTEAECGCMSVWAKEVKSGDPMNLEARAAAYYWKNLFEDIESFVRGQDEGYPNNLLNYGYAILRAVVARALVGSGLLPTLGIHHQNRYNAYCLADDIMEPYRPYVDQLVLGVMKDYPQQYELTRDMKACLLTIPTLDVKIRGKKSPLMIAAALTTASLAKCFEGEIRKIDYPEL